MFVYSFMTLNETQNRTLPWREFIYFFHKMYKEKFIKRKIGNLKMRENELIGFNQKATFLML